MRIVMAVLAVLLLAACQQPAANTASSAEPSSLAGMGSNEFGGDGNHMRYFRLEGDALSKELAVALLDACYGKIQSLDKPGYVRCVREQMTAAFDDSGKGRAACDHYAALDAYSDCVIVGNLVLQLRHQLDDDSPVATDFWDNKDAMVHAMVKSVVLGAATNCGTEGSEVDILACADKWLSKRLDVPEEYMSRCDANENNDDREACLGEAVSLQYMRDHMGRISKNAI